MFKFTLVASVLAIAEIYAAPIADQGMNHYYHPKRDMYGFGCPGCYQGLNILAHNIFPNTQFTAPGFQHTTVYPEVSLTAGSANIFGSPVSAPQQPVAPAPAPEQPATPAPEQSSAPAPAPEQPCVQPTQAPAPEQPTQAPAPEQPTQAPAPEQPCVQPTQAPAPEQPCVQPTQAPAPEQPCVQPTQTPSPEQPAQAPAPEQPCVQPTQAPAPAPEQPTQAPAPAPEQPSPAPAPVPEQPQPQPSGCVGAPSRPPFSFMSNKNSNIAASNYREDTLYVNHKSANSVNASTNSNIQLNCNA
ncbi:hypothetical protein H4R20_002594 [Coemansia guatemalensis]|uniref:Uncharacterized protein n=1 Tax=Coemansia guatemalensis TaxID=2761395 RepID=A0A9W8LUI7_9FUNG|nr:hypothetical protein H4R20_002594 [Coemansia guatemalensis]